MMIFNSYVKLPEGNNMKKCGSNEPGIDDDFF